MAYIPSRPSSIRKYLKIQERFNVLYNEKRIRYDDCLNKLMEEFFIGHKQSIQQILATPTEDLEKANKQMELFD